MLAALRDAGRLERVDAARVTVAVSLARAVDEHPENVGLWQQYRAAEAILREVTNDDSDSIAAFYASDSVGGWLGGMLLVQVEAGADDVDDC